MPEILIIEDSRDIVESIEYNLKKEGYRVAKAYDGQQGLKAAEEKTPSLIILDLMLPGIDGLEVCRRLKKNDKTATIPILILTAKGEESDKIVGLELGADDYMVKPFGMKELLARVRAILRRYENKKEPVSGIIKFSDLEIDPDRHEVKALNKPIELTAKEFQLLYHLAQNQGRAFSRDRLLDIVWGIDVAIETRTVDVHMRRLREKIGKAGKHLVTLRGVGYKFV
ncbi:DNA-binding response regulator [candidate division WOR-1 bacterium RIFOXYB2_FULL_48_7]|uniref:DNA-binding response regulator n=1 Tax=candidate division WOR-1 bacterium RIFOXYB2_FULL_48_7 TaxID=1802583 RepID=A0A1F4T9U0_UNCSA|nr:MAG: DNA-binding response regulator [candidate division WOR-1 bacterium RIFOXYB2_FULL_48_7]